MSDNIPKGKSRSHSEASIIQGTFQLFPEFLIWSLNLYQRSSLYITFSETRSEFLSGIPQGIRGNKSTSLHCFSTKPKNKG